jgi:hypothetical protein
VRSNGEEKCELIAPFGLDDLLGLKVRPAGAFADRKRSIFEERLSRKAWLSEFPKLQLIS